ncbi:hypothetical protein ACGFS9_01095 [Streptomyces sp. NPDC048566]|uniref:hypothetical protein n=1 Tax=Streptomyces sp. NPDC048566 TaxID=3365569 RepID=UPI00371214D4
MHDARAPGHPPAADLARHALDGSRAPLPSGTLEHLGRCASCRDLLAAYERVGAAARDGYLREPETLADPPPRVWEAILREVRAERSGRAAGPGPPPGPSDPAGTDAPTAAGGEDRRPRGPHGRSRHAG